MSASQCQRPETRMPLQCILQMYRPLLLKYAIIDGVLDEDLYQELSIILLKAIKLFKI